MLSQRIQRELDEAQRRLGLFEARNSDPLTHAHISLLRQFLVHVEDACEQEGVDDETIERIIHRVVYGCVPSTLDAHTRMDMMAEKVARERMRPLFPVDPVTGDPLPVRASPTATSH